MVESLDEVKAFGAPNADFVRHNFYNKDDVPRSPLKPLSATYAERVIDDLPMNSGGILTSWNPLSDGKYSKDRDIIRPLSWKITALLEHAP